MPPVRTPNQCCINNAIEQLSFDPTLQDLAWQKAQTQTQARPKPYQVTDKCARKNQSGEAICEFAVSDVLHSLGIAMDASTSEQATDASAVSARRRCALAEISNLSPTVQGEEDSDDDWKRLAHKNLFLIRPGADKAQSKMPTSFAEYLKRYPTANRIQLLAELAACLQYLHTCKVVHGSLRPDALFVDDEGFALLQFSPGVAATSKPPAPYTAPELLLSHADPIQSIPSDIYSFGSLIHWVCTAQDPPEPNRKESASRSVSPQPPFESASGQFGALATSSRSNLLDMRQNLTEWTDNALKKLVRQCRDRNPSKRPPMISVVLALQQIKVRHVLPALHLHLSVPMMAPLSSYVPRKAIAASAPSTPEARTRQSHNVHTIAVQPATPISDTWHQQSTSPRARPRHTHESYVVTPPPQDDFLASIRQFLSPSPTHSREHTPQRTVPSSAYRGASEDRLQIGAGVPSMSYSRPVITREYPSESFYRQPSPEHTASLRPWDILPPLPSTATLQPPSIHWAPQSANIHRNKTL